MTIGRWNAALLVIAVGLCAGTPAFAQITGKLVNPNVFLVIDSSRSMDWLELEDFEVPPAADDFPSAMRREADAHQACVDANLGTSPRQTSWQQLLDVMLGSIPSDDFHCFIEDPDIRPALQNDTLAATSDIPQNTDEYTTSPSKHFRGIACADENWNEQYGQCIGQNPSDLGAGSEVDDGDHWCRSSDLVSVTGRDVCFNYNPLAKARNANGILERYRTLARFGVMTYDNKPSPLSDYDNTVTPDELDDNAHTGWFDYGESRKWNCKKWSGLPELPGAGCTWNAGARSTDPNSVGRLVPISDDLETSNLAARDIFSTTEPLYCSPMGALLDDVGYYFNNEARVRPAGLDGSDLFYNCRPKVVIFISDGQPNQAFEFPQDYCNSNAPVSPPDPGSTTIPPDDPYACPWNSSRTEVEELETLLKRGGGLMPADAPVEGVYFVVIGFNSFDKGAVECDPAWNVVTDNCDVDERCIQIATIADETECLPGKFLTPRQFLNELALQGWPEGYDFQPPWRRATTDPEYSNICVDEIAEPDGDNSCGGEESDSRPNGAIFVDGPDELSAVLDLILSSVTSSVATRTEVVTTDQVNNTYDAEWEDVMDSFEDGAAVSQYEFNSGFEVVGGQPWRGYLYRQGYTCTDAEETADGGASLDTLVEYHKWLDSQTTRRLYTITASALGGITAGDYRNYFVTGFPKNTLQLIEDDSAEITDCDVGGPATAGCASSKSILAAVKKHLYGEGDSLRAEHKLADVYNSTPTILGPPMERITVASYQAFQSVEYEPVFGGASGSKLETQRPPILYVGTNDGVLHSFDVWGGDGDVEMWGYVPNALLGNISRQFPITWNLVYDPDAHTWSYEVEESGLYQHTFGVDGSPVAADVRLFRQPPGTTGASLADSAENWRSVVIGGLGKGGAGYYALDVTNPEDEPLFRWEISDRFPANNEAEDWEKDEQFVFGLPIGKPALTYVYVHDLLPVGTSATATDYEVAVAILPGGYKNDESNGPEVSTGVAIVRVGDGKKIRYLDPSVTDDLCVPAAAPAGGYKAQLVGEPAVPYPLRSLTVNDEAFIGDDRGRLWRIDMTTKNADDWCLEMFFDTLLTTHFPYQDCIPGACTSCPEKETDVTASCDEGQIAAFAVDDEWGTEACTGLPCEDPLYPFPRIPIVNAPTIVQDENRNNVILFGTGQIDGLEALDHHRIFSLTQRINYNVGDTDASESGIAAYASTQAQAPEINWWLGEPIPNTATLTEEEIAGLSAREQEMLEVEMSFTQPSSVFPGLFNLGEKMLGRIAVFNEVAYFTTFIPAIIDGGNPVDACESGGSRVWGVDFNGSNTGADWTLASFGKMGSGVAFVETVNDLQSGLKVVRRSSCSGQAQFQLVTQHANPAADGTEDTGPGSQPRISSLSVTIPQTGRGVTNVSIDSWSLVFN